MSLEHLKIQVTEGINPGYVFTAWINPATYTYTYGIKAGNSTASTGNSPRSIVKAYNPDSLDFKLILDATGVVPPPLPNQAIPSDGVAPLISSFLLNIARPYTPSSTSEDGKQLQPKLLLSWAQLQFACILTSLKIDYKLFKPNGTPIRAELTASFAEYRNPQTKDQKAIDLPATEPAPQQIIVLEGDTLPGLCDQIYGDASYYMIVAKANGLTEFRRLKPGSMLTFPPIKSG